MVQPICTYIISLKASKRIQNKYILSDMCVCADDVEILNTKHATNDVDIDY